MSEWAAKVGDRIGFTLYDRDVRGTIVEVEDVDDGWPWHVQLDDGRRVWVGTSDEPYVPEGDQ